MAALALLIGPPSAGAEEGVYVDPNSAPGKEYAVPFEAARAAGAPARKPAAKPARPAGEADAAATEPATTPAAAAPPAPPEAFGAGITPKKPAKKAKSDGRSGSAAKSGSSTSRTARQVAEDEEPATRAVTSRLAAESTNSGSGFTFGLLGVVGIFALGGLLALGFRRFSPAPE